MLSVGDAETNCSIRLLAEIVRRMTMLPGQRSMILISRGFQITDRQSQMSEILDRAVRANIVVNSVDARGLYASPPGGDISQGGGFTSNAAVGAHQDSYRLQEASAQADPMAELADGTGGTFFHNSNDLEEGFRRVAAAPEVFYGLGSSPQHFKLTAKSHPLKLP